MPFKISTLPQVHSAMDNPYSRICSPFVIRVFENYPVPQSCASVLYGLCHLLTPNRKKEKGKLCRNKIVFVGLFFFLQALESEEDDDETLKKQSKTTTATQCKFVLLDGSLLAIQIEIMLHKRELKRVFHMGL